MFSVEIQMTPIIWRTVCTVEDDLDEATAVCRRVAMSEKVSSRISEGSDIVFEAFYNQADDPDYYEREDWRDTFREDDVNLRWQEVGF